jgi:hypothetical protein
VEASLPIEGDNKKIKTHQHTDHFNLSLPWRRPIDATRSSQVCKSWQTGIEPHHWKENVNPVAFSALAKAAGHRFTSQQMAAGLIKIEQATAPPMPKPTIRPEDIYFLLEVEVLESKYAWCQCLAETTSNSVAAMPFQQPSEAPIQIVDDCGWDHYKNSDAEYVLDNIDLALSVWRADRGQVASLNQKADEDLEGETEIDGETATHSFGFAIKPSIADVHKLKATHLFSLQILTRVSLSFTPAEIQINGDESDDEDSEDEEWKDEKNAKYFDMRAESAIEKFELDPMTAHPIVTLNDYLLLLQTLDWK